MTDLSIIDSIRTRPFPRCIVCGTAGDLLHEGLKDELFGSPGEWNFRKCLNDACGHVWMDPMPHKDDIVRAYRTYYTHQDKPHLVTSAVKRFYRYIKLNYLADRYGYRLASRSLWGKLIGMLPRLFPIYRARLHRSIMYLPAVSDGRLLEIGCGNGDRLQRLQELGWIVEGVELDPQSVAAARQKGLHVRQGLLETQNYPDNYFDSIIMNHVIEHVHEPMSLARECCRILKPGGAFVVVTPNGGSWGHSYFTRYWRGLEPPRHLHLFTMRSLAALAKKTGFVNVRQWSEAQRKDILFASLSLARTGSCNRKLPQALAAHLEAFCMQLRELMLLRTHPEIGEETVLFARKT